MTVCVVLTARASYARVQTVLEALRDDLDVTLQIVLVGQALVERYGDLRPVLAADGFSVTATVPLLVEGDSRHAMAAGTGVGVIALAQLFATLKPDTVVTIADRYETLATATAASYLGIRLVHLQGGEQTGSIDDKVRNAVTALADVHCVATFLAAERVWARVADPDTVYLTGCPSIDLCTRVGAPPRDLPGLGATINTNRPALLVVYHPVVGGEPDDTEALWDAVAQADWPTIWFWPNADPGSDPIAKTLRQSSSAHVRFVRNLPPLDFLALLRRAIAILGNSSVGIREASFFGTPSLVVGSRQDGRERGPNAERWLPTVPLRAQVPTSPLPLSALYGHGGTGQQIAAVITRAHAHADDDAAYTAAV